MSDDLSRRNFLFYGGATVAGVTLGQAARRAIAWADEQASPRSAQNERWTISVCRECPAACGVRVRLVDERPVKLEGNPLCPIARGRLCAKGQAAVEAYSDPDRLTGPARRLGPHGSGSWERISWEEATGQLADRLRTAAGRPGEVLAIGAEETGPIADAWRQIWTAIGAQVHLTAMPTATRLRSRFSSLTGVAADPCFDLEHATHVLSLGAPLVEDWLSPVWTQRAFGRLRRWGDRPRGRLVQVEGRRSMTARKADSWIAVPTDRQVSLAYGIAAVLVRESRFDRALVDPLVRNLSDFEQVVMTRFTTEEVSVATGVPVITILRLARELAAAERPLVVVGADSSRDLVDAMWVLNILIGAFDRPGGIYAASAPVYTPPAHPEELDATARPRVVVLRDAAEFRTPATMPQLEPALSSADLVVAFTPFLDEAASVADLVLPTHTALESWHAVVPATCVPSPAFAVSPPAVVPLLDTRDLIEILKAVADAVGGPMAAACPWTSSDMLVSERVENLASLRRGGPYASVYETEWMLQLERGGWWSPAADSPEAIARAIVNAGGWADPFFEIGQITRRIQEQGGCSLPAPPVLRLPPLLPIPPNSLNPLRLEVFIPAAVNRIGSPNQPSLYELLGQPEAAPWGTWVEIGPETAERIGVTTGQRVQIASASNAMDVSVVVVEGMLPGVAALAFVPAVPTGGRWAREIVQDVRSIAPTNELLSGPIAVQLGSV